MKAIAGFLLGAVALALLGSGALSAARFERHMADAQQQAATGQDDLAGQSLAAAEEDLPYARWLPGIGADAAREVASRRASLQYWQRDYDGLVADVPEPVTAVDETNVDLQFIVANAAFRLAATPAEGSMRPEDWKALVQALDEAAAGYLTVLKNDRWHEDAAFNYEYAVRLRDEMAKARQPPPQPKEEDGQFGQSGAPSEATTKSGFKIYVPLEGDQQNPEGGDAGKASPRDRKG